MSVAAAYAQSYASRPIDAHRVPFAPSDAFAALAINGGSPTRAQDMPNRNAFGPDEVSVLTDAIAYYSFDGPDPNAQGRFEAEFCDAVVEMMGGGYADAVATGTGAVFVALEAMAPAPGSEILVSPIVDAGALNCILYQGCAPVILDAAPGSFNVGLSQVLERVTSRTSAAVLAHSAGEPIQDIEAICAELRARGVTVLEDFSQAPGAHINGRRVGTFGDIAAASTMHQKTLYAGGSGGVVYSVYETAYRRALACADRGKAMWRGGAHGSSPAKHMFPALNWHTDELSCAIGLASVRRIDAVIAARMSFVHRVAAGLGRDSFACRAHELSDGASPNALPIWVDESMIACSVSDFAEAVAAEGIALEPDDGRLVCDWSWAERYIAGGVRTPEAQRTRDSSFLLCLNEQYSAAEADDALAAILKVERAYLR